MVYRTMLLICERNVGWLVTNKRGGRQEERDEAKEKW